ncbi:uncharacterized protein LOC142333732 [Lycorma delicatula]|uniref:uncharacterized protein LOC142333732 n=1 Tax=Lycorma delicatula TaxID=130591 RepID=UPI003F510252
MAPIKLILIVLLSVVYFNEADGEIDIKEYKTYYTELKTTIMASFQNENIYHTQISCYQCILAEINKQLNLLFLLNRPKDREIVEKNCISGFEEIKNNFAIWENLCTTGYPTDTRKTFYEIYSTANYNEMVSSIYPKNMEACLSNFIKKEFTMYEISAIQQHYQDDLENHEIFQATVKIDQWRKDCMNCIKFFLSYELKQVSDAINEVDNIYNSGKALEDDKTLLQTVRNIFMNYQTYLEAVRSWLNQCALIPTPNKIKEGSQYSKIESNNIPLITEGNSLKLESCINDVLSIEDFGKKFTFSTKKYGMNRKYQSKPTELIKRTNF